MSKRALYGLGFLTLFGFGGIGVLLVYFLQPISLYDMFSGIWPWYYQLGAGIIYGILAAVLARGLLSMEFMEPVTDYYRDMFSTLRLNTVDVLFISFCAGFGEELLFRSGIQYWLGVWITSFIFIAIHGYLNPRNWRLSIYGLYMVFLSGGLGLLYIHSGYLAAAIAHFTIDVILLWELKGDEEDPNRPIDIEEIGDDFLSSPWPRESDPNESEETNE